MKITTIKKIHNNIYLNRQSKKETEVCIPHFLHGQSSRSNAKKSYFAHNNDAAKILSIGNSSMKTLPLPKKTSPKHSQLLTKKI